MGKAETRVESRHTPGPWTVGLHDNYPRMGIATVFCVSTQPTEDGLGQGWVNIVANASGKFDGWRSHSKEEQLANAYVIAAAPAILAVLEEIVGCSVGTNNALDDPYIRDRALEALAAARGTPRGGQA